MAEGCSPDKKAACKKSSGPFFPVICETCKRRKQYQPSAWFNHIWELYLWELGGYPFKPNDLRPEEWQGIGIMKRDIAMFERT